jgi:hypothetical protein
MDQQRKEERRERESWQPKFPTSQALSSLQPTFTLKQQIIRNRGRRSGEHKRRNAITSLTNAQNKCTTFLSPLIKHIHYNIPSSFFHHQSITIHSQILFPLLSDHPGSDLLLDYKKFLTGNTQRAKLSPKITGRQKDKPQKDPTP